MLPMPLQSVRNRYGYFTCMQWSIVGRYNNTMYRKLSYDPMLTVSLSYIRPKANQIFRAKACVSEILGSTYTRFDFTTYNSMVANAILVPRQDIIH
jgi:hypothetical protein